MYTILYICINKSRCNLQRPVFIIRCLLKFLFNVVLNCIFVSLLFTLFFSVKPFVSAGFSAGSVNVFSSAFCSSALILQCECLDSTGFLRALRIHLLRYPLLLQMNLFSFGYEILFVFFNSPFTLWGKLFSYIN